MASLTQVCYKIGFIESNTQIYWSSHELRKILGETVHMARLINLCKFGQKTESQFYHCYVLRILCPISLSIS